MNRKNNIGQVSSGYADDYVEYGAWVNRIDTAMLFERYEEAGFLYDAKKAELRPYWEEIAHNWRCGLRGGELVHYVVGYEDAALQAWAYLTSWRSTHRGWITQHLVSSGAPFAARAIMLGAQGVRLSDGKRAVSE